MQVGQQFVLFLLNAPLGGRLWFIKKSWQPGHQVLCKNNRANTINNSVTYTGCYVTNNNGVCIGYSDLLALLYNFNQL
jgi:hypothetical protein